MTDVRAILLDIEGTTTPIAFVYEVLFPYARAHFREYLQGARDSELIGLLEQEWRDDVNRGAPVFSDRSIDSLASYIEWLMDRDRKSPGLKRLQGLVWQRGYRDGELKGDVFDDVPPALERWRTRGIDVAIYSSGSVLAQQLLFSTTPFGDLTRYISDFFDTSSGAKTSSGSYARIAAALGRSTEQVLFVSDVTAEVDAARSAGCQVALSVRPGNAPQHVSEGLRVVHTFDELF
ncbi:MAG TPA: acireductone synthase [Vicinamibacterales bacterium]|nr:acireductone synthase [Vicinamibacterales bacterium]